MGRHAYQEIFPVITFESSRLLTPVIGMSPTSHGSKCGDLQALTAKFHDYNSSYPPAFLRGEI